MNSPPRFTVVSLFAGCGGSSLGYHLAGGKVLLAVEWDKIVIETYKLNFPETPIYEGDICKLSGEEALSLAGIKPGELDILDGSPPCQGFSISGKREFTDNRNQLFMEYIRLLKAFRPKVLAMENVSGMIKGKMKLIFVEILRELKAADYRVKVRLMNAKYYGVPQDRARLIFLGIRDDLGIEPGFPKPQGRPITVNEAFRITPPALSLKNRNHSNRVKTRWAQTKPGTPLYGQIMKLDFNKPSITLIRDSLYYHHYEPRCLNLEEEKILCGFPPEFKILRRESLGNAVMPPFMKAIAEYIRDNILTLLPPVL